MEPFNSMRNNVHLYDPHFRHFERIPACDHCTYFKGVVYRAAVRYGLTGEDEAIARQNNMAGKPRSLESIALAEEAFERREHTKYMDWCKSITTMSTAMQIRRAERADNIAVDTRAEESDTLMQWVESSTKEELLCWFTKHRTERGCADELSDMGIFDLREYILQHRKPKNATKKPSTAAKRDATCAGVKKPLSAAPSRKAAVQSSLPHKSIKPPQAALRQREELHRWYDSKKAPELKDELKHRGIIPVPKRKSHMIEALVADDKKET